MIILVILCSAAYFFQSQTVGSSHSINEEHANLVNQLRDTSHRDHTRRLSLGVLSLFRRELEWVLNHPTLVASQ